MPVLAVNQSRAEDVVDYENMFSCLSPLYLPKNSVRDVIVQLAQQLRVSRAYISQPPRMSFKYLTKSQAKAEKKSQAEAQAKAKAKAKAHFKGMTKNEAKAEATKDLLDELFSIEELFTLLQDMWTHYKPAGETLTSSEILEVEEAFLSWLGKENNGDSDKSKPSHGITTSLSDGVRLVAYVSWAEGVCELLSDIKGRKITFINY
jgi:hypothetical protein